jgi:hypothetical protein
MAMGDFNAFSEEIESGINTLEHHGILGQKWGIRRFQNKDGSLTELGKKRASEGAEGVSKVLKKGQADATKIRIAGNVKSIGAQAALTVGSAAAGAALGSLTGNPSAVAGGAIGGSIGGAGAGKTVSAIIKTHANEKADALSQEYLLLGQKMMKEYGKISAKEAKREALKEEFWDSKERYDASAKAYDDTYKWYEKNEPEQLKAWIKDNGGNKNTLDQYHDFRKMNEGYEDEYWSKAEEEYIKKHEND